MRVVPAFHAAEDREPDIGMRGKAIVREALHLEFRKEALDHGVVVGIGGRAHRRPYVEELAALPEGKEY